MGFLSLFKNDIENAERKLGSIAGQLEQSAARGQALQDLEARARQAAADGKITKDEFEDLMQRLERLGADTTELRVKYGNSKDVVAQGDGASVFAGELDALADGVALEHEIDTTQLQFELQRQLGIRQTRLEAASELNRIEHQGLMNVIGNMKA